MYHCLPFLPTRMSTRFDSQWHCATILWLFELPCVKMFDLHFPNPQISSENLSWRMDKKTWPTFRIHLWSSPDSCGSKFHESSKDQRSKQGCLLDPLNWWLHWLPPSWWKSSRNLCEDVSVLGHHVFYWHTQQNQQKDIPFKKKRNESS